MIRIGEIIDKIYQYYPADADVSVVEQAYVYSAKVHDGQMRLSGEPYLSHPLEVAGILADLKLDVYSIAAGLLHDVIEDSHATEEDIEQMFGPIVKHIVSGVTKLAVLNYEEGKSTEASKKIRHAESVRKMLLAMADDIRVIMIKLADRLHNMKTLQYHPTEAKRKKISQETMDIYAPIAARLGMYRIKKHLEDLSFKYLMPDHYSQIEYYVERDKIHKAGYIESVTEKIRTALENEKIQSEVVGRYKHYYSIYNKMVTQNLDFDQIYDIIAFRIIVESKAECYAALGMIHDMWQPINHKIKDYIGRPKPNKYQSLHTTVIGPKMSRIEIQIRTKEMDHVARFGIAAHWSYKEGKPADENICKKLTWIQNLVENQENISDPDEFLENVRIDLYPDEVNVFTPTGEVKSMPRGSTPVDFAYLIHSEVGNRCVGAKVNGRMVPLKHVLETGDVIEILTHNDHHPSKDWLSFVKTVKAKSRIKQWIRIQEKNRSIVLGREMCEKAFRKHRLNFSDFTKSDEAEKILSGFGFKTLDDLIAGIGYGKVTPLQIIKRYQSVTETTNQQEIEKEEQSLIDRLLKRNKPKKPKGGIVVRGCDDILIRFGKCCQPLPGDQVIGFITRGQGITVHRAKCVHASAISPDRMIDVEWNTDSGETHPVNIVIRSHDRVGLLADLAAKISKLDANIVDVKSNRSQPDIVETFFTLAVRDIQHLEQVMSAVRKVKHTMQVWRLES